MSGIGGIGGMGGMGGMVGMVGMGGGANIGAAPGIAAIGQASAGLARSVPGSSAEAATPAAQGSTVSISQAAQNAFNAEVSGVGAHFTVTATAEGLQVTGNVTGLDSGRAGMPVSADISVDISRSTPSLNSSEALNDYDELIATLILALLMQQKEKSDVTIQIM